MSIEQQGNGKTDKQNRSSGKDLRKLVPRSSHGDWAPAADRPDPLSLLQNQDKGRIQSLLPIKYGRMLASPFAFLRGSAVVMASDLSLIAGHRSGSRSLRRCPSLQLWHLRHARTRCGLRYQRF